MFLNTVIEVTRKCNLQCGHCLRGCDWSYESQEEKEDIQVCTIDNFSEWLKEYSEVYEKQYA